MKTVLVCCGQTECHTVQLVRRRLSTRMADFSTIDVHVIN